MLDRDKLHMVSRIEAVDAAHKALDALQRETPEIMVAAASILFAAITRRCGLDGHEQYLMGHRVMREAAGYKRTNDSVQSLLDFAGIHIKGDTDVQIS
jgi:hypothetical protein